MTMTMWIQHLLACMYSWQILPWQILDFPLAHHLNLAFP